VVSQIRGAPGRSLALLIGILIATTSFAVLSGAARTGTTEVRGTVAKSFRAQYDLLVRPAGTQSREEQVHGLIRPGTLTDVPGGITLGQWRRILKLPGVQVAAPIATIGYALPSVSTPVDLTADRRGKGPALFRIDVMRITDRGLTRRRDTPYYTYITDQELLPSRPSAQGALEQAPTLDDGDGDTRHVCITGEYDRAPQGPFDPVNRGGLNCASTRSGLDGRGFAPLPAHHAGTLVANTVPIVIAAIDPVQEQRLTGLASSVVSGRYLRTGDRPSAAFVPQVPVLVSSAQYADEATKVTVVRLRRRDALAVQHASSPSQTRRILRHARGTTVRTETISASAAHRALLYALTARAGNRPLVTDYWTVSEVGLTETGGVLRPAPVHKSDDVWQSAAHFGFVDAPLSAKGPAYRRMTVHEGATTANLGAVFSAMHAVGQFDPRKLKGGDPDRDSVLDPYTAPGLAGADDRSRRLLGGRTLLPNGNLAGYLAQPPTVLTNLRSLPKFKSPNYKPADPSAPISVIRVRVAGVHGIDAVSRERVRQAAQQIQEHTHLTVDLVTGSSATTRIVTLPKVRGGRPALRLEEPWLRKGVAVTILQAVDRKSLALFVLILVVGGLFVGNATSAAVAARRSELALLACTGWSRGRLFATAITEVGVIGLAAGVTGAAISLPLCHAVGTHPSLPRSALAIPGALLLTILAGVVPALRAAQAHPAHALRPAVVAVRSARSPRTVAGLAFGSVLRTPQRTAVGVLSLAVGVSALTVLLTIVVGFKGSVVGSVLGDAVSVQVRAVDLVAVGTIIGLSAVTIGDVLYLNVRERAAELAVLRAVGWSDGQVASLIGLEALWLGLLGAALGVSIGLAGAAVLTGGPNTASYTTAAGAFAAGVMITLAASVVPALLTRRLPAAELLAVD
jgi:ABC-type lipoprotein release transport system permease subunit